MHTAADVIAALQKLKDTNQATNLSRFFKTGPGQYGEGDVFWGIKVPVCRQIVRQFKNLPLDQIPPLLEHEVHEVRLTGLLILVSQFSKADAVTRRTVNSLYLQHTRRINNWDLVDLSAPNIVGNYLLDQPDALLTLTRLAKSDLLWERRIAVIATFSFIREGRFEPILELARILLNDQHDLMHKAVGWMLREAGKRDELVLRSFLDQYTTSMPRTMLRYAIERLNEPVRIGYLHVKPNKTAK